MSQPAANQVRRPSFFGTIAAWWGLLGTVGFLVYVCKRLIPLAVAMNDEQTGLHHWGLLIANVTFMAYSEGYRGFQKNFCPRVAARAAELRDDPSPLRAVLAPLYVMGFFSAPPRVLLTVYTTTIGVAVLVQIVRTLEQPWRGIIDAGVVVGLGWGAVATLYLGVRTLRSNPALREV